MNDPIVEYHTRAIEVAFFLIKTSAHGCRNSIENNNYRRYCFFKGHLFNDVKYLNSHVQALSKLK